jgi:hypothetical protein
MNLQKVSSEVEISKEFRLTTDHKMAAYLFNIEKCRVMDVNKTPF